MPLKLEYKYRTAGFIIKGLIKQKKTAEALDIALGIEKRHPPDNDYDRAIISQVKATCYDALGNDKKAEELYILALKLFGDVKTDEIVSLTKYDIAKFYIKKGEFKKAGFYLNEGITNVISIERKRDYHLIYYKIDSANGNYISALQHHIQFKMLNDSIFNIEKNRQFQELQVRYETEQKERDILSLKKESVLQHEKAAHANNTRNFTLLGGAMLIVLLGVIYSNNRAKQRSNVALSLLVNEKDKLLEEKEWLMKEIHHRVKNNLQIVMGLLQRQSAFINNKEALTAIRNSEHRMHSIALIHQKLYQSESLAVVTMGDYIDEMIGYLRDSFDMGTRIRFEKQVDQIDLEINVAVPLGLILNEAITNAIKYAFPTHEKGCIRVSFNEITDVGYILQIADDGRGLPADFDIKKINSMGFNLMRGLSKQVGGVFEVAHNNGVTITIKMAHV
jgi:two-component sensor histidine kinase